MPTQHIFRLLAIIPAARQAAVNTWVKANIDSSGDDWFTIGLSTTGNAPAQAYWASAALTPAQFKLWMVRLCALAGISQPGGWDGWTRQQRKQWLLDQRSTIRTNTGIWCVPMDNDGPWDSPEEVLTFLGLKVVGVV